MSGARPGMGMREIINNKYVVNTESFIEGTYIIQGGLRHEKLVMKH